MTNTEAARTAEIAAIWTQYPERLVTISTGIVHVAKSGATVCGTRTATRIGASDITPTCRMCGAK